LNEGVRLKAVISSRRYEIVSGEKTISHGQPTDQYGPLEYQVTWPKKPAM